MNTENNIHALIKNIDQLSAEDFHRLKFELLNELCENRVQRYSETLSHITIAHASAKNAEEAFINSITILDNSLKNLRTLLVSLKNLTNSPLEKE